MSIAMRVNSSDLRLGLHRVLAVSHALALPVVAGERDAWWAALDESDGEEARDHRMGLKRLAELFRRAAVRETVDTAREKLGLTPLRADEVDCAFLGASNTALWSLVCADFLSAVEARFGSTLAAAPVTPGDTGPSDADRRTLDALTGFDTSPRGEDHDACALWLRARLEAMGFDVDVLGDELGRPLVVARREARSLDGHVALYGHYDVTPFGRDEHWEHPPRVLTESEGRLFARGVADNKGPLACRLAALESMEKTPRLTWLIQGEEETGSAVAHALLPALMAPLAPTLWLDETGYHDHEDGTLRLLGRTVGPNETSLAPDDELLTLLQGLRGLASRWGIASRHESRGLNKSVVEGGCPFDCNLPLGSRYLAVGVNDSAARIHGLNESVPGWTFGLHAAELDVMFHWANHVAGGAR